MLSECAKTWLMRNFSRTAYDEPRKLLDENIA